MCERLLLNLFKTQKTLKSELSTKGKQYRNFLSKELSQDLQNNVKKFVCSMVLY